MIFIVFKESICIQSFTFQNLILLSPSADDLQKVNWSNVWPAMSDQQCLTSNVWPAMSDQQCLTSNVWPAMSDFSPLSSVSFVLTQEIITQFFWFFAPHFIVSLMKRRIWKMFPHSDFLKNVPSLWRIRKMFPSLGRIQIFLIF